MTYTAIALIAFPASILGLALYVFAGGLVVRALNKAMPSFADDIEDVLVASWPLFVSCAVVVAVTYYSIIGAYRLSQWSPKSKSALPGARVVKP